MKDIILNNKKRAMKGCLALVLLALMVVIFFTLSSRREEQVLGESVQMQEKLPFEHTSTGDRIDYNFKLPVGENPNVRAMTTDTEIPEDSESENPSAPRSNGGSPVGSKPAVPALAANTLLIPKLNVNTKVIGGIDGEAAIHDGAWMYPSSYEAEGEKILLGHRRYWGADDPRSFWNLDQLTDGDMIHYADAHGKVYSYEVKAVSVRNAGDLSILKASKENIIKVISCSTADGSAGSAEMRIVVIATQV